MDLKILVASLKPYWMPADSIYLPIQVGAIGKDPIENFLRDDSGQNISEKNQYYSELSGLYWAWKNLDCEYLGLCHYRRYFGHRSFSRDPEKLRRSILNREEIEKLLDSNDLILPRSRNYFIETIRSQYIHAHSERDLIQVENILAEKYPEYLSSFEKVMNRRRIHLWNMFIMPKILADEYCAWLFDILFTYEHWMDQKNLIDEKRRLFGYISERLLDVWLCSKNLKAAEVDVVMLERVNWTKKIFSFLGRKFQSRR